MKKIIPLLAILIVLPMAGMADDNRGSKRFLKHRISELEDKVMRLERQVKRLERITKRIADLERRDNRRYKDLDHRLEHVEKKMHVGRRQRVREPRYVCYLSGSRNLYTGRGDSAALASQHTLRQCRTNNDAYCQARYVACSENR